MQISGLQKLTLIDYPKKLACTIFLQGCNFRCGFCHNPELVLPGRIAEKYSAEQVLEFLQSRKQYLEAVCITGGEPLLDPEVLTFIAGIKALGYLVKLDTNGSNPGLLQKALEKNLIDYIAMDIKSCKDDYDLLTSIETDLQKIEQSMRIIMHSNLDYEFRTTVIKGYHTPESLI
ncbi:MAG TPA: anaerobic ribonucleoside-triphosphate reductase activating protein, partial [Candidatus Nanoarchaeia archaeon]|nr:anaerobic ribonucleoside-triphosphate reductase activating protein [Candidatus Nanoarchaeia archaeon]